jgi:hypothetical protein
MSNNQSGEFVFGIFLSQISDSQIVSSQLRPSHGLLFIVLVFFLFSGMTGVYSVQSFPGHVFVPVRKPVVRQA